MALRPARKVQPVTADDLGLSGAPPRTSRRRSNIVDEPTDEPKEAVLTHHDAPVDRVRRVRPDRNAPAAAPTTVVTTQKYVKIQIEENENVPPTGMFISLNGRAYLVKPGVPVDVPPGVIEILNNAVEKMSVMNPETRQVVGYRDKMRYPYRVIV